MDMKEARNGIILEDYINLVRSIAAKYKSYGVPFEDLVQEGMIGLMAAKERYDAGKGASFSTYATFWVKKAILDSLQRERAESFDALSYDDGIMQEEGDGVESEDTKDREETGIVVPADFPSEERMVLELYFNEKKGLSEIAEDLKMTRERVRQLKQKGLRRLRGRY